MNEKIWKYPKNDSQLASAKGKEELKKVILKHRALMLTISNQEEYDELKRTFEKGATHAVV